MADHSQTIVNGIAPVAGGVPNLWNANTWNSFRWGTGSIPLAVGKSISESVTPDSALPQKSIFHILDGETLSPTSEPIKDLTHYLDGETLAPDDSYSKNVVLAPFTGTIDTIGGADYEYLQPGDSDWTYVFPSAASNAEDRDFATWTSGAVASPTWNEGVSTSITWSQQ